MFFFPYFPSPRCFSCRVAQRCSTEEQIEVCVCAPLVSLLSRARCESELNIFASTWHRVRAHWLQSLRVSHKS